jgi:integrase
LGHWPVVNADDARKAALVISGRIAAGRREPGLRTAVRFDAALDEYLKFLRAKSARKGKPARHALNVEKLRRQFLSPEFGRWPLADLSNSPEAVRDWHEKITKEAGPVSANRAAQALRATYRFASRLNRSLPPALPTSAIVFNTEVPSEKGLAFADFPKWCAAWERLESPVRRAYHMVGLLTGCRPGELARLEWKDIRPRERAFVIGGAKAGNDIRIPFSIEIVRALKMARGAAIEGEPLVFPECGHAGHRDDLPARGQALRHTYRTICADLGIDELISHYLLGHAPAGISQRYILKLILASGPAMRAAQAKISRRIVALLNPTVRAPALSPDGPQEAEVSLLPALS